LVGAGPARGPEPWFACTGNTLFVGAVGRPDLPGDERMNAAALHRSVHDKLLRLPDMLEIYPAHFAGSACGLGMSGKPTSTIAFEKRWNPLLGLSSGAFVDEVSSSPLRSLPEWQRSCSSIKAAAREAHRLRANVDPQVGQSTTAILRGLDRVPCPTEDRYYSLFSSAAVELDGIVERGLDFPRNTVSRAARPSTKEPGGEAEPLRTVCQDRQGPGFSGSVGAARLAGTG